MEITGWRFGAIHHENNITIQWAHQELFLSQGIIKNIMKIQCIDFILMKDVLTILIVMGMMRYLMCTAIKIIILII